MNGQEKSQQSTNMEIMIKREWCPSSDLEISIDLIETDWVSEVGCRKCKSCLPCGDRHGAMNVGKWAKLIRRLLQ